MDSHSICLFVIHLFHVPQNFWKHIKLCQCKNINNHFGASLVVQCWESACQCRGHGFEPWSGKIPHAAEQLGPWATPTEPARLEPVLRKKRGRDSERPTHRDEEWPPLAATRESPRAETKTQHNQKTKKNHFTRRFFIIITPQKGQWQLMTCVFYNVNENYFNLLVFCISNRARKVLGTFLVVQWLRLHASNARGTGSIPGQGTKIPQAVQCHQKKKKDPSTSLQITQFRFFLWLSNTPLYICATSSLSIYLLMDT